MTIELNKEYQWDAGWSNPIAHTDIKEVVKELKEIEEIRGEITPEFIVESAKNKKSVLHSCFVWDDAKAAHKYRLIKASELLRRITIKVIKDGEPRIIKAFEITKKDNFNTPKFNSFDLSSSSSSSRNTFLIKQNLSYALNRALPFPELKPVVVLIEKAIEELSKESTETPKEEPAALSVAS